MEVKIWSLENLLIVSFGCFVFGYGRFFQLDGFVARKLGISSVLGSYLDPLADKVCCLSFFFSSPFFPSPIFLKTLQS